MADDEVEIPIQRVLYRQSSLETRLEPAHLSDEESSNSSEDEHTPKVVDIVLKPKEDDVETKSNKEKKNDDKKKKETKEIEDLAQNLEKNTIGKNYVETNTKEQYKTEQFNVTPASNSSDNLRKKSLENLWRQRVHQGTLTTKDQRKQSKETVNVNVSEFTMATLRPKSPRPTPTKNDKEESIWDKIGTLGRKKRIKEVQEVEAEGKYAIDSPGNPSAPVIPPEEYELEENEERSIVEAKALQDAKFQELQQVLIEWINDELSKQRIIVQDLAEDLYDGQVLQKLLEILTGDKLDVPEVTQSEEAQKQKLTAVLDHFNHVLGLHRVSTKKWSVQAIHSKNIVPIMHLLVALARHFRPPVRLTEHVIVPMVVVKKVNGQLQHRFIDELITASYDDVGMRCERDAFDTLFDHAPEKLQVVKKSMVTFVNKHLNKINLEVSEIESQFHDGVYLTLLMGLLEGFFVPLHSFHLTPREHDQKVHNVAFAFELMEEVGIPKPKARPEDIVNFDLKSTLRVLYNLFIRYRNIS